jgi:hypothetical protein
MARLLARFGLALLLAALPLTARAVDPDLNAVSPTGVQRGTEVELTFSGANLAKSQELLFYSPGFTVKSLTAADDKSPPIAAPAFMPCGCGRSKGSATCGRSRSAICPR